MARLAVASSLVAWIGATLLLSTIPWFRVPPLVRRLQPYTPEGMQRRHRVGLLSADSLREVVGPLLGATGDRLAALLGIHDSLAARLARSGSTLDVAGFRLRQAGWALAASAVAAIVSAGLHLPMTVGVGAVIAAPLLAFLILEQHVSTAARRWQERVLLELPVLTEQLGMLLSSGYSLGGAISRLGGRGRGPSATELRAVTARVSQGVTDIDALREWAQRCDIPAVDRLVSVLALNWEASDLGALISAEARSSRREVQRRELETIEKRSQQVWIPVTVATLLPGVIFMAVPFVDAMFAADRPLNPPTPDPPGHRGTWPPPKSGKQKATNTMTTDPRTETPGTSGVTPRLPSGRSSHTERGEGVISTAIAVLIIAFLGVGMWAGFNTIFKDATDTTSEQVQLIGR